MTHAIEELLADHQGGHSDLQIERFITIRGNWTAYGRYKQCLREIDGRHHGLQDLREEAELAELDLQDADHLVSETEGSADHTRRRIARDRQQRRLDQTRRAIAEQERELQRFVELATELQQQLGELTPERRSELERELWAVRTRAMVALDLFTQGSLSPATAELLIALPADIRRPILAAAKQAEQQGGLFDWLEAGPGGVGPTPAIEA